MKFKLVLRYAAFCAATQGPVGDTPRKARLLRDRPSIRRTSCGYSGTGWRYAAQSETTQGPPFDTPHFVRLLRDRGVLRRG
ncbi:MAG: hypothetical protein N2050_03650 [Flavobacteriales bacterium]|nr:hypothetical protein [Flavobacteriales bacterium]